MLNRLLTVAILGGLMPLGAALWWPFELVSHFRLQFLAAGSVLLLIGLARKRRLLALGLALCLVLNAWPLLPYVVRDEAVAEPAADFVVLNVNVNASNAQHDRILAALRAAAADLVTLIELSPALEPRLAELGDDYPYRFTRPAAGNFGLALLSRFPLIDAQAYDLGSTPAIDAWIDHPAGRVHIMAAHLVPPMGGTQAARRNVQLELLAALARDGDEPLVLCGDFNLSAYSPYFRRFESGAALVDTGRRQGLRISWPSFMPLLGIPIDHCFVRGPLATIAVETMDQTGSDHYPVRVRFRWQD